MFRLFHSIFGTADTARQAYPESLVAEAIERAADATDPRIRALPGYAKQLREPVIHAIDHVIALVDSLPAAVTASRAGREANPTLAALFFSTARMSEILGKDSQLRDYFATTAHAPDKTGTAASPVTAMLAAERHEKTGFGYALVDDKVLNDVQQTIVSFDGHRLLEVAASETETRRQLKRRAFDYLLSVALTAVTEQRDERNKLSQQRALLRAKLDILHRGGSSLAGDDARQEDRTALQTRLAELENRLATLGPVTEILHTNLTIVAATLLDAEKHLWLENRNLRIDQHHVLHVDTDTAVPAIPFVDVCGSDGRCLVMLLLSIPPEA